MDSEWKIDVKKASAQLPPLVRDRLKKVVERFVGTSKRTYRSRGQRLVDETRHPIWNRVQQDGRVSFRPNLEHPVFKAYSDCLPEDLREGFRRCLRLVGSGLPVETLHAELVGNAEMVVADEAGEEDLRQVVYATAKALIDSGLEADSLLDTLQSHPFLRSNWYSVKQIIEDYLREGNA
jgi:hypothetical protein